MKPSQNDEVAGKLPEKLKIGKVDRWFMSYRGRFSLYFVLIAVLFGGTIWMNELVKERIMRLDYSETMLLNDVAQSHNVSVVLITYGLLLTIAIVSIMLIVQNSIGLALSERHCREERLIKKIEAWEAYYEGDNRHEPSPTN